jgi:hypothetical protein
LIERVTPAFAANTPRRDPGSDARSATGSTPPEATLEIRGGPANRCRPRLPTGRTRASIRLSDQNTGGSQPGPTRGSAVRQVLPVGVDLRTAQTEMAASTSKQAGANQCRGTSWPARPIVVAALPTATATIRSSPIWRAGCQEEWVDGPCRVCGPADVCGCGSRGGPGVRGVRDVRSCSYSGAGYPKTSVGRTSAV